MKTLSAKERTILDNFKALPDDAAVGLNCAALVSDLSDRTWRDSPPIARGGHTICWPPERLEVSAPPRARLSNPEIYLSQFAELLRRVFVALRISQTRP